MLCSSDTKTKWKVQGVNLDDHWTGFVFYFLCIVSLRNVLSLSLHAVHFFLFRPTQTLRFQPSCKPYGGTWRTPIRLRRSSSHVQLIVRSLRITLERRPRGVFQQASFIWWARIERSAFQMNQFTMTKVTMTRNGPTYLMIRPSSTCVLVVFES